MTTVDHTILSEDVRLLKLLGAGLLSRYTSIKSESTLLTKISTLPGSSVPAYAFNCAETAATKIACMIFQLGVVQWGFNTVDKITSRELILLITRAAEKVEAQQDVSLEDRSLVRHLHSFLLDVAKTNGKYTLDSDKERQLTALLSSPKSGKSNWLLQEDLLRAQLTVLSTEIESVREQLVKALSQEQNLNRTLQEERKQQQVLTEQYNTEKQVMFTQITSKENIIATNNQNIQQEKSKIKVLELQLAASEVRCSKITKILNDEKSKTIKITESVDTLMHQLTQKTLEVQELERVKLQQKETLSKVDRLEKEVRDGRITNNSLMNELKLTEQKLIDIQSYMNGEHGTKLKNTEYALAEARLNLAQCESEKDDLVEEVEELKASLSNVLGNGSALKRHEENRRFQPVHSQQRNQNKYHQQRQQEQHWG